MELVEDHRADAVEPGIGLQHPGQDALGHHLDPGALADLRLAADPVAHGGAHRFAERLRHPLRGGAGGEAARLQHHDPARHEVEQREWHPCGLARTGRRDQHGAAGRGEGGAQARQGVVDRQRGGGGGHGALVAPGRRLDKRRARGHHGGQTEDMGDRWTRRTSRNG